MNNQITFNNPSIKFAKEENVIIITFEDEKKSIRLKFSESTLIKWIQKVFIKAIITSYLNSIYLTSEN